MARRACFAMNSALVPVHVVRRAVHGICVLSVDSRSGILVERSAVMRIATIMISYQVLCSNEYDTLAQNHIRNKSEANELSQSRRQSDRVHICAAAAASCARDST